MNAGVVWQIIVAASALGAVALWLTLWWLIPPRRRFGGIWRWLLVTAAVLFFVLPAPVPNYSGAQAPAFVVMIFETFFQRFFDRRQRFFHVFRHRERFFHVFHLRFFTFSTTSAGVPQQ